MQEGRSYLTSERDDSMRTALVSDIDFTLSRGEVNETDFHISTLGLVDLWTSTAFGCWTDNIVLSSDFTETVKDFFIAGEKIEKNQKDVADFVIEERGYEEVVNYFAELSLQRITSDRIPGYNPQNIESWIRRGLGYAASPLVSELLKRDKQPLQSPSTDLLDETIVRVACVSEALREIKRISLNNKKIEVGKAQYIESLDGLLLEYDAYIGILEKNRQKDGKAYWAIPAGPNLDYGPNNSGPKGDIVIMIFNPSIDGNRAAIVDVKSGLGKRNKVNRMPIVRDGQAVLTARNLGCVKEADGKEVLDVGVVCDDYISCRNNYTYDRRITSKEERFKLAMMVLKLDLQPLLSLK